MNRRWLAGCVLAAALSASTPALAVLPDEVLADPALETRARTLSAELRCMVCQNQSIDDSEADLARDIRLLVRERLKAGDTNDQVLSYLVSRYGEFVLLKPRFDLKNGLLWATPVLLLALAGAGLLFRARQPNAPAAPTLSAEDEAELKRLTGSS